MDSSRATPSTSVSAPASSWAIDARRLAQAARQLERDRQREVAQRARRRVADSERRLIGRREVVALAQKRRETRAQNIVNGQNHRVVV